ncbi:unnamed protein product [Linum tenue]|uniref:Serine aminopeptidase S33 domain-containing protein n=1 Tax=Linum tenue TaxID=586396 RepID=A0AAV0IQ91_9ROSI|nr:unnamed protein product [Linum tenue]
MDDSDSPPVVQGAASLIPVDLFVSKKHPGVPPGDLGFADSSGDILFRVARVPASRDWNTSASRKKLLLDSSGSHLISLHRLDKRSWKGFEGGEDAEKDMIFRVKRTVSTLCRTELEVFLTGQNSGDQSKPDFKVKGCCFQRSCTIYSGDSIVAQTSLMYKLHQIHARRNKFRLTIFPGSIDHALVVALVVQRVIIPNKDGEKLVGVLHDSGSKEIVILCHGFQCSKDHRAMVNLATTLEKEGITAFRFDFSGNGESEGSFAFGNYKKEVDDLRSVVEHFAAENRVVTVMLGHSRGGGVVLLYASKFHSIRAVVNTSGRYDLKSGIKERLGEDFLERIKREGFIDVKNRAGEVKFRVTEADLMDRMNINMHKACQQIDKDCRVLTIHGSADEVIPVGDAYKFAKIIPNHELHIVEGADHGYKLHQAELASAVLQFVKSILTQDTGAGT